MTRSVVVPGATEASVIFPDWNGDGRKDFVTYGNCTDANYLNLCPKGINAVLCYNLGTIPSRPDAPQNCQVQVNPDGSATFTWEAPETAKACFTYEVFVQDAEGNLLNSIPAFVGGDKNGIRKINRMGRVGCQKTWRFCPPAPGTYKWGVQTIDAAYSGSVFTEGPEFTIPSQEDGIRSISKEQLTDDSYYDLSGRKTTTPSHLIYIKEGKKVIK